MLRNFSNTAPPTTLSVNINNTATSLPVASTAGYPAVPFLLALERGTPNEEVCLCTAIADGTHFTVTRGYDGTPNIAHNSPAVVEHSVAAIDYREANANINLGDIQVFGKEGTLTAPYTGKGKFGPLPYPIVLLGVSLSVYTGPTGADLIVDLNRNGTTVFTTQANRPKIVAGSTLSAAEAVPDVTSISAGDYLSFDIDQVGSAVAGDTLQALVRYRRVP